MVETGGCFNKAGWRARTCTIEEYLHCTYGRRNMCLMFPCGTHSDCIDNVMCVNVLSNVIQCHCNAEQVEST